MTVDDERGAGSGATGGGATGAGATSRGGPPPPRSSDLSLAAVLVAVGVAIAVIVLLTRPSDPVGTNKVAAGASVSAPPDATTTPTVAPSTSSTLASTTTTVEAPTTTTTALPETTTTVAEPTTTAPSTTTTAPPNEPPAPQADARLTGCSHPSGSLVAKGTVTNTGHTTDRYRVNVAFNSNGQVVATASAVVGPLAPGQQAGWTASADYNGDLSGGGCTIKSVTLVSSGA